MFTQSNTQTSKTMLNQTSHGSENFLRWSASKMLRGGRVTKRNGVAASYSPEVGLVLSGSGNGANGGQGSMALSLVRRLLRWSAAPMALLAAQSPAFAQDACVEVSPNNFVCEDNGDPATTEQDLSGDGGDVIITLEDGFDIDTSVAGGDGFNVYGANSVVITQSSGSSSIIGDEYGIDAFAIANGIDITTGGDVTGLGSAGIFTLIFDTGGISIDSRAGAVSGGTDGILALNSGTGDTTITTADVTGEDGYGITARNADGAGNLTIDTTAGAVMGRNGGIEARQDVTGALTIVTADVTSVAYATSAIEAYAGASATGLTIDSSAGAVSGGEIGIEAYNAGIGNTSITTADVTGGTSGEGGVAVDVENAATAIDLLIDTTAGSVASEGAGLRAVNAGTGATTVITADAAALIGDAIFARNEATADNLTIDTSAGAVTGGNRGIVARNYGTGVTSITTADVDGEGGDGVFVSSRRDTSDLSIDTSQGAVVGGDAGIDLDQYGFATNTITTGDVTGLSGSGIEITAPSRAGVTSIDTSSGTVTGAVNGIDILMGGYGTTLITAGVDGEAGDGIEFGFQGELGVDGAIAIDSSAGTVTGTESGIYVAKSGLGDVSIATAGVSGDTDDGIYVRRGGVGDLTIDSTAGAVSGGQDGIDATNYGSGDTAITTADVTGIDGDGIALSTGNRSGAIAIDSSAGAVSGGNRGVSVYAGGLDQDTSIVTGDVTGAGGSGIEVRDYGEGGYGAGAIAINTVAGAVNGAAAGIDVENRGTGDLTITTGDVTGTADEGIRALSLASLSSLTIDTSAGAVNGGTSGIESFHIGSGTLAITTGDVTGEASYGIFAYSGESGSGLAIDSSAGAVSGATNGINASNGGYGSLAITTGDVTSTAGAGISSSQQEVGDAHTIDTTAGTVTGSTDGIRAFTSANRNYDTQTTITTADVSGTSGDGIFVRTSGDAGDLIIDSSAGAVTGGDDGIYARNNGAGDTAITTADVTGTNGGGISIENAASAGSLTVDSTAGNVTSASTGIFARNNGTGALTLTSADISAGGPGIYAASRGTDIAIDTSAGAVTSEYNGVRGVNRGTGDMTITTGDVTSNDSTGIIANNGFETSPGGANLIVDSSAGTVIGGRDGVFAGNFGTGDTTIITADVTGTTENGVEAVSGAASGSMTIDTTAGAVTGGTRGLDVDHFGSGALTITTGDVTGGSDNGINAETTGAGLILDTSAGTVTGGDEGIEVYNFGNGDTVVTTADVSGAGSLGLYAFNSFGSGDLIINSVAGSVSGETRGIEADQNGRGALTITAADVESANGIGIVAETSGDGVVINTLAGTVSGATIGIRAENDGSGDTDITTGNVSGDTGDGIRAFNEAGDTQLVIDTTAGTVTGGRDGIFASHYDSGDIALTTGEVVGEGRFGVYAVITEADGGSITIDTTSGAVIGQNGAVRAVNYGTGDTTITTADVTGAADDGVEAINGASAGNLTIDTTAGAVTGSGAGINAAQIGTGEATVITGDVTGETQDGITLSTGGNAGDVLLDSSAGTVIGGGAGISVSNFSTGTTTVITADVSSEVFDGINVSDDGEGVYGADMTIDTTAGTVNGALRGIIADNRGTGDLSITTADVTGSATGISASNGAGTGDLTLDTVAGAVSGGTNGINVLNNGTGVTRITTADVAAADDGIFVSSQGTDVFVDTAAGSVSGTRGIVALVNQAAGLTSITTGDVTSVDDAAITVTTGGTDLIIDSTAGSVTNTGTGTYVSGIDAANGGTGSTVVTTANVSSENGFGVEVSNGFDATDLTLDTTAGVVSGGTDGVRVNNRGTGVTSVTTADVTGGERGVYVEAGETAGDIIINTSLGSVTGGSVGVVIQGDNDAVGDVSVTTADVTSQGEDSVAVVAYGSQGNVIVDTSAGTVSGGGVGVAAISYDGSVSITTADVSASGGSYGEFGFGVIGYSLAGDVVIDTTAGSVDASFDGAFGTALYGGSVTITAANVDAEAGSGITASATDGDVTIDTAAGAITAGQNAIQVNHEGTGSVSITAGNLTAAGGDGVNLVTDVDSDTLIIDTSAGAVTGSDRGIYANHAGSGDLTITVGNVTGQSADGILATTSQTTANILVQGGAGVPSNVVGATTGIALSTQGADITVSGLDSVTGQAGDGLNLVSNGGDIAVSDIGTVTGLGGNGIFADADSGNILIDNVGVVGGITATGGIAIAAYADNGGTITIGNSGTVSGETYGVDGSASGDITIDTTDYDVTGAVGIRAVNSGAGATNVTTADVTATGGEGITASSDGTDVSVNSVAGTVTGLTDGIRASNTGSGTLNITTANVTGTTGDGIAADTTGSDLTIDSSLGTVSGDQRGIAATNLGTGDLTITTADVAGNASAGVQAVNEGTSLTIDTTSGTVAGNRGIVATNRGTGLLSVTTADVAASGGTAFEVNSGADGNGIVIDTTAGSVSGGFAGIIARENGSGAVTVLTGDVIATGNNGVYARNFSGTDLTVDTSAGAVTSGGTGINATNFGVGSTNIVTGPVESGDDGVRVFAGNLGNTLSIDTSAGQVTSGADGIDANSNGSGDLTIVTGDIVSEARGVNAINDRGNLTIDTSAGSVTGTLAGIVATQGLEGTITMLVDEVTGGVGIDSDATTGATTITLGSTALVTGTSGFGIDARSEGGDITVQGSSGTVTGATDGIYVRPTTGDITVANIDRVEGLAGDGLDLFSLGGDINVSDVDAIIGTGGNGISATTNGAGTISLALVAATTGTQSGLAVSTSGGAVTITNSGNLSGGDFAVLANGPDTGPITLNNSGTIASAVQFAAANDSFTNSGTFAARGASDFGDGADSLTNTGTIAVAGSTQFNRLETLQSGGLLSLVDQNATGSFTTSGDFVGTGGQVALDFDFAAGNVDQLIIEGAATGTSTLVFNALSNGLVFADDFVVVQAGAGTEATAFALESAEVMPFLNADLRFDAATNSFSIGVLLGERVFQSTKLAEAAQALWYRSTDAWADHRASTRFGDAQTGEGSGEGRGEQRPFWVVAYGISAQRDEDFADTTGIGVANAQLDYSQDFFGLQTGVDHALSETVMVGITGGFMSSNVRQDSNGSGVNFDALNIGLSASVATGGFFADALVKYDTISGNASDRAAGGFNGSLDGESFGLRAQAGYRIGSANFYAEPNVAFDLQKTNLDDLVTDGQTFAFDGVNGARGSAGIRFGGESSTSGGANIGYYLGANVVHEFDGEADVRFIVADGQVAFRNNPIDTYGNVEAGLSIDNGGPVSGFFQAESDVSNDFTSFGAKVGMRVRF